MPQGSIKEYDVNERTGIIASDDGSTEWSIDPVAMDGGMFRFFRTGQRVTFDLVDEGGDRVPQPEDRNSLIKLDELSEELARLVETGEMEAALSLVEALRPADAADLLESLDDDRLAPIFEQWRPKKAAGVLSEVRDDRLAALADRIPLPRLADILDVMAPDEAAEVLEHVRPDFRARILGRMERDEASDVAELLDYPENSAGRRMSQDFVAVGEDATADEVIEQLRSIPEDVELIYYVYVLGGSEQLKGVVSLRTLITAPGNAGLGDLMDTDVVSAPPTEDIESIAEKVRRYNLIALPVTDDLGRMLGIVTVDDLMETMEDESQENLMRFAGSIEDSEVGTRRVWPALRQRLPWLATAAVVELTVAYLLLRRLPPQVLAVTVAYVPLLLFMGGNTAVQAAARVLVRQAGGRTDAAGAWRQAQRELEAGLVLALLAAAATFPFVLVFGRGVRSAAVVAPAVALAVLAGAGLGAVLPIGLKRIKMDPAIASGPLLGSAMDIVSLFIYASLALRFSQYLV